MKNRLQFKNERKKTYNLLNYAPFDFFNAAAVCCC